jgi:hypothetical protein
VPIAASIAASSSTTARFSSEARMIELIMAIARAQ